jgi:enhancing lycopene biosynthesis protein 2
MDRSRARAEQLLTLSSAARRIADLVAVAPAPLRYEVIRHLLRVSEETMTEALEEAVHAGLVRRGDDPFTYVPFSETLRHDIIDGWDLARRERIQRQIAGAHERVFGD